MFSPFVIAQRKDDTVHFYYNLKGVTWMQDTLIKQATENKNFIPELEKSILQKLKFIQPIYEEEKILSFNILIKFIRKLEEAYRYCEPMWWFFEMDDESKVSHLNLKSLAEIRKLTDKLCNGSDTVIRKSL